MPAKRRKRKQSEKASSRQAGPAPGWAWMLLGLSIGLAVALVVYLRGGNVAPQEDARVALPAAPLPRPSALAESEREAEPADDDAPAEESPFGFYEGLAEFEVVVPETELEERPSASRAEPEQYQEYMVQAGSFRRLSDADRRQASLALLGIESRIHRVSLGDEIYHRVMIGPFNDRAEVNRVMRRLRDANIESLPLAASE